jgi:hypothetical protein
MPYAELANRKGRRLIIALNTLGELMKLLWTLMVGM